MTKDYCTFSPEGNWGSTCCKKHDEDYESCEVKSRLKADWDLAKCIASSSPHWTAKPVWCLIAGVYFTGVRIGGWPLFQKHVCKFERMPVWKDPVT